jgi:hypothetical protein
MRERRLGKKQKISHGLTRNDTEKTETETRKENQAEAFATECHGMTRK